MTLAEFERIRADVSHCLLRNGVFSRLGASPSIVESDSPVEVRAQKLATTSLAVVGEQGNFAKAASTWLTGDRFLRSVKDEVSNMMSLAKGLEGIAPGEQFPDVQAVAKRIEHCDHQMRNMEAFFKMNSSDQREWLLEFWRDALVISDVLRSFGLHTSTSFWGVFRSTKRL